MPLSYMTLVPLSLMKSIELGSPKTCAQVQVLPFINLGKSFHLSEPPLPYCKNNTIVVLGIKRESSNGIALSAFCFVLIEVDKSQPIFAPPYHTASFSGCWAPGNWLPSFPLSCCRLGWPTAGGASCRMSSSWRNWHSRLWTGPWLRECC